VNYKKIQDTIMSRLNLTSVDARNRVELEINTRYLEVTSTLNLAPTRYGEVTVPTVSGQSEVTVSGVELVRSVLDETLLKRPLDECDILQLRAMESDEAVGPPTRYAVKSAGSSETVLRLHPQPTAVQNLTVLALMAGTDLANPNDEPSFPASFHDILVKGVLADEYAKLEKFQAAAKKEEAAFEKRLSELRYFLHKRAYLSRKATSQDVRFSSGRVWPYPNGQ
jgi:hypothetical protein